MRILLSLLCGALVLAQAPPKTDRLVEELLRDWHVPGLALSVVHKGRVVHQKGYGLRDVEGQLPVTTKTAFAFASITKSLTVLLLHTLAAEGKLDWDAPVRDQLPGFKLADAVASERATPRDLVSHRTGMPRHDALWAVPEPPAREELLRRLGHLPASADFRTTYQYNNLMFVAAGMAGARAAGSSWEQAVRARVLEPLGLGAVAATYSQASALPELARPYNWRANRFEKLGVTAGLEVIAPAGGSAGTIEDLTRYLQAHMSEGRVNGGQALAATFFQAMRRPHTVTPATGGYSPFVAEQAYGMGLTIGRYQGRTMIYHTGTISGYHAMLWWMPEEELGVAVLLNRVERAVPHILCLTLADRMLGTGSMDWSGIYKKNVAPPPAPLTRIEETRAGHPLAHYAGVYTNAGYGLVTVEERPAGLTLVRSGVKQELAHWHYETFAAGRERVTFRTDVDGTVDAVEMKLEPSVPAIVFTRGR